jgi:hypothetical protein
MAASSRGQVDRYCAERTHDETSQLRHRLISTRLRLHLGRKPSQTTGGAGPLLGTPRSSAQSGLHRPRLPCHACPLVGGGRLHRASILSWRRT